MGGVFRSLGAMILLEFLFFVGLVFGSEDEPNGPVLTVCSGTCTSIESPCEDVVNNTNCGSLAKCCLDGEDTTAGFDFTSLPTETSDFDWDGVTGAETLVEEIDSSGTEFSTEGTEGIFTQSFAESTTNSEVDASCPGACIPIKHAKFCQYVVEAENCEMGSVCCATEGAVQMDSNPTGAQEFEDVDECPGRCVPPSLTIFCDKILGGYQCPTNFKCCNDKVSTQTVEVTECLGQCLPSHLLHLCVPPYELVSSTNCNDQTCCVKKTTEEFESQNLDFSYVSGENEVEQDDSSLAHDESGQVYYVSNDGMFKPLPIITPEESLSEYYAYFTDLDIEMGKVSLYRDSVGKLYQLSIIQAEQESPDMYDTIHYQDSGFQEFEDSRETFDHKRHQMADVQFIDHNSAAGDFKLERRTLGIDEDSVISVPDDSNDIEKNMKDVLILEGEESESEDSIPSGERTMVKPQCPGSCISSFLRFTCFRGSAPYDGFSCPDRAVCCANLADIEEHEQYLKSIAPYFQETSILMESNGQECRKEKGSETNTIKDWCWQVALINSQNQYICGGALVDSSWVVTAAHCVTGPLRHGQAIYIRAGVTDLTSTVESTVGQTRRALSIFVHHQHNSVSLDNDIALLRLHSPFELNVNTCTVCLPSPDEMVPMNTKCHVTGYGFVNKGGKMSLKMDHADVDLVDDLDCISNVTEEIASVFILPASSICAGGDNRACQGDAGGPLVCDNKGLYKLTGLVSWGLGCGKEYVPSIYVKVQAFMDWMSQIISATTFLKAVS